MTKELKMVRVTDLKAQSVYYIYCDKECIGSSADKDVAELYYKDALDLLKHGYPKEEIIKCESIFIEDINI